MSSTETNVVGMTREQVEAKYGKPADGKHYAVRGGFVVFDETGSPVQVARKQRAKGGGKKSGSDYPVVAGGLRSHETPDFKVGKHRKLKQDAFKGCDDSELAYLRWNVWYNEQLLSRAKQVLQEVEGTTPETRKEARDNARALSKASEIASASPDMAKRLIEEMLKSNPALASMLGG